jgi:signal transduction histidine kinase
MRLGPAVLVPLGARILAIMEEMTGSLGHPPGLRMAGQLDTRVPGPIAEHMLAALREALANVAKHAHATRIDVIVEAGSDLVLRVRDNGVGLPQTRRSGLGNLADRAGELHGTFHVGLAEGGGAELEWRAPLSAAGSPDSAGS